MLFVCVWLFLFGAALIFFHLSVIKTGWLRRAFVRSVKEKNSSWLGVPGLDNVFNMWRYLYTEYLSSDTSWWTFEQQHALNLTVIYLISLEMEKRYIHRFFSVLTPLWIALVQLMPRSITLPLLFSTYALALRHKGFDETSYVMVRHAAYYSLIPVSVPIICLSFLSMASYPFRDILLFLIHLWPPLSSLFVLIAPSRGIRFTFISSFPVAHKDVHTPFFSSIFIVSVTCRLLYPLLFSFIHLEWFLLLLFCIYDI